MEDEIDKSEPEYKSRTKKKKEAEALQALGLQLSKLTIGQLKRIDIPQDLRAALIEGKSITANVAARRHRQFIGVLMRDVDPKTVQMALDGLDDGVPTASSSLPDEVREWMEKLLSDNSEEIESLLSVYPDLDRQRLRQLVRNVKKEKPGAKPSKSRKALEQMLTDVMS